MEFFEFEYINGFRSNSRLVYTTDEKHIYKKKNNYNKGTRYECYDKNCDMSVFIDDQERCRKLHENHTHNHPNQELLKNKMQINQKIKNACKDAAIKGCSTRRIFEEECRKDGNYADLVQYEKIRRNLQRIKKQKLSSDATPPHDVLNGKMDAPELISEQTVEKAKSMNTQQSMTTKQSSSEQDMKIMELLDFEYINGFRSNSMLVYTKDEKQIYKKQYNNNSGSRYGCYNKNCSISIFNDQQGRCRKTNLQVHNHPSTQEVLRDKMLIKQKIKNECKAAALKGCSTPDFFVEACRNENYATYSNEYNKNKRNLCRIKNNILQANQSTFDESAGSEEIIVEPNLLQCGDMDKMDAEQAASSPTETPPEDLDSIYSEDGNKDLENYNSEESSMYNNPWPSGNWHNIDFEETLMSENVTPLEDVQNMYSESSTSTNYKLSENDSEKDIKLFEFEQINLCSEPKDPLSTGDLQNVDSKCALIPTNNPNQNSENMYEDDITVTKYELTEYDLNNQFFEFEYINGFRSNSRLVYTKDEKQIYMKKNYYNNGVRYQCYSKNCVLSVFIDEQERCRKLHAYHVHKHPTQEQLKTKMQISQKIKNACKNASLKRCSTRDIFEKECRNEENAAYLVQFEKMRRNLYRIQKRAVQKNSAPYEDLKDIKSEQNLLQPADMSDLDSQQILHTNSLPPPEVLNHMNEESVVKKRKRSDIEPKELLEFEYISGFRSSSMLVYTKDEKQIYKRHNNYNNGTRYVCYSKYCNISIFIDEQERCRKIHDAHLHTHPTQEILKDKMYISQKIKNAFKDPSIKSCNTRVIFDEALRDEKHSIHLVEYEKMRANLSRIKRNSLPKEPLPTEPTENTDLEALMPKHRLAKSEPKKSEFFEFEYINGFRSSSKLVYTKEEKQIYRQHNKYNKGTRYVCYSKNCGMSVFIDKYERCRKLNDVHAHNHPTQQELKDKMLISHKIKNACKNAVLKEGCTARDVFEEELRNEKHFAHLVEFKKMKRNLCRLKNSGLQKKPKVPKDANNIDNENTKKPKNARARTKTKSQNHAQSTADFANICAVPTDMPNNPWLISDFKNFAVNEINIPNNPGQIVDLKNVVAAETTSLNHIQTTANLIDVGTVDSKMANNQCLIANLKNIAAAETTISHQTRPAIANIVPMESLIYNNPWLTADLNNVGTSETRMSNTYYHTWQNADLKNIYNGAYYNR
ncbi:uncharacterized protein [Eurosta solidaginis]|uniref:uncharacterized protein n=1 Tax=Eurosta solidaginis TaxID=178769 RepID=UPI0035307BB6